MHQILQRLIGRTVVKTEYMAMDTPNNTNGSNETIILTLDDGSAIKIWSYGYSLDYHWIASEGSS